MTITAEKSQRKRILNKETREFQASKLCTCSQVFLLAIACFNELIRSSTPGQESARMIALEKCLWIVSMRFLLQRKWLPIPRGKYFFNSFPPFTFKHESMHCESRSSFSLTEETLPESLPTEWRTKRNLMINTHHLCTLVYLRWKFQLAMNSKMIG